jgi:hypothetical protein
MVQDASLRRHDPRQVQRVYLTVKLHQATTEWLSQTPSNGFEITRKTQ